MAPNFSRRNFLASGAGAAGLIALARSAPLLAVPPVTSPTPAAGPETCFSFTKTGALFPTPGGMPSPGPYYPCLVKMDGVPGFPFDYALYFSTDHDSGRGGIWLHLCRGNPADSANWSSYDQARAAGAFDHLARKPEANPIYIDTRQGSQTETPHANVIDGKVFLTYHQKLIGKQATMLASSADGVNFERIRGRGNSIILPAAAGANHTGYFRWAPNPFHRVASRFIGYSLYGGGDDYHSAMWGSDDAVKWDLLEVFTPREGLAMPEPGMIMIWHELDPGSAVRVGDDEYVLLSAGGNRASGGAARVVELYEVFLAGDGKTLTRECRRVLGRGTAGSPDAEELAEPTLTRIGDDWLLVYIGACDRGRRNTVMAARGRFNPR